MTPLRNTLWSSMWLEKYWKGENFRYFSRPEDDLEVLGIGETLQFRSIAEARLALSPDTFAFVEQKFSETQPLVVIPALLVVRREAQVYIVELTPTSQKKYFVENNIPTVEKSKTKSQRIQIRRIENYPDQDRWEAMIEQARKTFALGQISKLVLARKTCFETDNVYSPAEFSRVFLNSKFNSYCVLIYKANELFFSKTPEKLFRYSEGTLQTVAIAGTQPQGSDPFTGIQKNQREHSLVVEGILSTLDDFSDEIITSKQDLIALKNLVHLRTPIEAKNISINNLDSILARLHPTPAISGLPQNLSLDWLKEHEPLKREYYAGVCGVLSSTECELAVTIRSGTLNGKQLNVFTGVGVVEESQADMEWRELELKLENILSGFEIRTSFSHTAAPSMDRSHEL